MHEPVLLEPLGGWEACEAEAGDPGSSLVPLGAGVERAEQVGDPSRVPLDAGVAYEALEAGVASGSADGSVVRQALGFLDNIPVQAQAPDHAQNGQVNVKAELGDDLSQAWDFFYSPTTKLGWRVRKGDKKGPPDWSLPIDLADQGGDDEDVAVRWEDGFEAKIQFMTVGQFKAQLASTRGAVADSLWTGEHVETHHKLQIVQRADRGLIIILQEQSRQVCQLRVNLFGVLPEPQPMAVPRDNAVLQDCEVRLYLSNLLYL